MNDAACMNRRVAALEQTIAYLERRVKELEQTVKDLNRKMVDHLYTRDGEMSELVKRVFELEEQLQPGIIAPTPGISAVQYVKEMVEKLVDEGVLPPSIQPIEVKQMPGVSPPRTVPESKLRGSKAQLDLVTPAPKESLYDAQKDRSFFRIYNVKDDEPAQPTVLEGPK